MPSTLIWQRSNCVIWLRTWRQMSEPTILWLVIFLVNWARLPREPPVLGLPSPKPWPRSLRPTTSYKIAYWTRSRKFRLKPMRFVRNNPRHGLIR